MKKLVIVLALLLATLVLFAACEGNKPEEQHVHTFSDWIAEIPATCTEDGTKGHFHCSECGKDFDDDLNELSDIVIPKPGHSFGNLVEGKPASCTEDGLTAYYHCSVCNKNFDMDGNELTDPVIHAEGHKLETIADADPTCDTKGAIAHQRCTVCDARFDMDGNPVEKEAVEIPALGHKFGEWIPASNTSCDVEGTKGHYHCEVCGRDYAEDEKTEIKDLIIPVGHVLVMKGDLSTGKHYECSRCGKYFDIYKNEIAATDIDLSPVAIETAQELVDFSDSVNAGNDYYGKTVVLMNDIDLAGIAWEQIGTATSTRGGGYPFRGIFDGRGYTIKNMTSSVLLEETDQDMRGALFGYLGDGALVENFKLTGTVSVTNHSASIKQDYFGGYYASVANAVEGEVMIYNVYSSVNINTKGQAYEPNGDDKWVGKAVNYVAGMVGLMVHNGNVDLTITDCMYDGSITATNSATGYAGILAHTGNNKDAGKKKVTIQNTIFAGSITLRDAWNWGGTAAFIATAQHGHNLAVNLIDCIAIGKFNFPNADSDHTDTCGQIFSVVQGDTKLTLSNIYYTPYSIVIGGETVTPGQIGKLGLDYGVNDDNILEKTTAELVRLRNYAFTDAAEWKWNAEGEYNIPCPKSLLDALGEYPEPLVFNKYTAFYDDFDENHPVSIKTEDDLLDFAAAVNKGATFEGIAVKLTADLDMKGLGFNGVGETSSKPFMGNFDGQGHTITLDQTFENPDGNGGLFNFVRVPKNGTITIQNLHITGLIALTNTSTSKGYVGGLISCVDAGTSGNGGTLNVTNCWSSVCINAGASNTWYAISGFIGFARHAAGLKPIIINMDSCIWDGVLNFAPAAEYSGGFVGYTGNQGNGGRPLTLNITNSVVAGQIKLAKSWSDDTGLITGYLKGNGTNNTSSAVTANFHDLVIIGKITSSVNLAKWCSLYQLSGTTTVDMNNFYYISFDVPGKGAIPVYEGTATPTGEATEKTTSGMYALKATAFSDSSKWTKEDGYFICPTGIVETFGNVVPDSLLKPTDVHIHVLGDVIPGTTETDTESGTRDCYQCTDPECPDIGKYFDADCNEIDPVLPHDHTLFLSDWIDEIPAVPSTATNGVKGHYHCNKCGDDLDADLNKIDDLTIYPYITEINNATDLKNFRDSVNEGVLSYTGQTVKLYANIDISGEDWVVIGTADHPFTGNFDGQGHTISGLTQTRNSAIAGDVGLFGFVQAGDGGTITIKDFKLTGTITGTAGGTDAGTVISRVAPTNTTGDNTINISGIWSEVNFEVSGAAMSGVGGILGSVKYESASRKATTINIDRCWYSGTLDSNAGSSNYGGIVGWSQKNTNYDRTINITNCLVTGTILLSGDSDTMKDNGGIIGFFNGTDATMKGKKVSGCVENCIFAGSIQHKTITEGTTTTGYIIGEVSNKAKVNPNVTVTNCYYVENYTGAAPAGWLGLSTQDQKVTATNVESKTLDEIKATDLYKSFFGE